MCHRQTSNIIINLKFISVYFYIQIYFSLDIQLFQKQYIDNVVVININVTCFKMYAQFIICDAILPITLVYKTNVTSSCIISCYQYHIFYTELKTLNRSFFFLSPGMRFSSFQKIDFLYTQKISNDRQKNARVCVDQIEH